MARARTRLLGVLAGVALLVAGGVVAYLGYGGDDGPDGAVRSYYQALIDRDAPRALAWGHVPAGRQALLTSAVLAEQQRIAPMTGLRVGRARRTGTRARVPVSYRLGFSAGPVTVRQTVTAVEHDGGWRLAAAAVGVQLELTGAADRARVLHARVPADTVLLFPGAVPISFDTPYLQLVPSAATVGLDGPSDLDVGVELSPAGRAAAQHAVRGALTRCVDGHGGDTCPLPDDRYVPGSLRGTVRSTDYTITLDSTAPAGVIEVSGSVPFHGTYRKLTFVNQVQAGTGNLRLDVHAEAYAVPPLKIRWLG